jgi:very-short-patch-repair endonuclease
VDWGPTASAQAGLVTRAQLRISGLTDDEIDGLLSRRALVAQWRGVFLVRGAPLTYEAKLWRAVLVFDGVLGFGTAAHLWGAVTRPDRIEIIIPRASHRWRDPSVRTHRIDLRPDAITTRNGLPITTRRETLLDHIGRLRGSEAHQLADRALQLGWLHPNDFARRCRQQPGRIGNTRMRLLDQVAGDGAAAESERLLHRILRGARISGWVPNLDLWHEGELIAVIDVAFREQRVAIEVDGMAFHSTAERFQRDRTRQNNLVRLGWTIIRFTWDDLVNRPGYVVAEIRHHLGQ